MSNHNFCKLGIHRVFIHQNIFKKLFFKTCKMTVLYQIVFYEINLLTKFKTLINLNQFVFCVGSRKMEKNVV